MLLRQFRAPLARMLSTSGGTGAAGEDQIRAKLQQALRPTRLTVTDTSGGCGSMYAIEIEAECFRGHSRVKQTQMVNALLREELKTMHGMRVLCTVPPAAD
ncbi:hypothetical protein H4R18_005613 [Coemansia javaensis]|uniref:Bola-like protein n=1 Tax=Coemansia javaensis TaxID=2761396 RepID=A0A9W8LE09_9FUNG|nr:hypothetical protein H4R18_005613 [Coemansia javaensis]